ncbi:MAG: class I SAM-dependent methyltransferase [Candidatus Coproplasma sp.]
MKNQSSLTSLLSAYGRCYHSENEQNPIFKDGIIKKLFTEEEYNSIANYVLSGKNFFCPDIQFENDRQALSYLINTQIAPTPVCRSAYCEQALRVAYLSGTRQYVILGAGLDTFAYRQTNALTKCEVFEIDRQSTQEDKLNRIKRADLKIPNNLHMLTADLTADNLLEKLTLNGFDRNKKTFFSLLGVSYYLTENSLQKLFSQLSEFMAEGSSLVFDYGDENLFLSQEKRVKNMLAMAEAGGEPMLSCFSYHRLEKMLEDSRLLIYELLTPNEIQTQIINPKNSRLKPFEHINYALAVKK